MSASLGHWNQWLLSHYFGQVHADTSPVSQLLVTGEELASAAAEEFSPDEAVASLTRALRTRVKAGRGSTNFIKHATELDRPCDFLAHLVVTCLAASTCDSESFGVGDYRERLRDMLADVSTDSLGSLPELWKRFARWLTDERARGRALRALRLPAIDAYGSMNQIGISVQLAFPVRRDQKKLIELLAQEDLIGQEPPVYLVTELLSQRAKQFTPRFQQALQDFIAMRSGKIVERDNEVLAGSPFWSAVRQAARQAPLVQGPGQPGEARLELFCSQNDYGDLVLYLAADSDDLPASLIDRGFVARADDLDEEFRFVVTTPEAQSAATDLPVRAALDLSLPFPRAQRVMREGVLLFDADAFGEAPLARVRPEGGGQNALVKDQWRTLAESSSRETRESTRYPGWLEVRGFDVDRASAAVASEADLPSCLQQIARPVRLRLEHPYVRLNQDALLGFHDVLPGFRLSTASVVRARTAERTIELARGQDEIWRFPKEPRPEDLEGACEVVALTHDDEGREVELASVTLSFQLGTSLCIGYRKPKRLEEWRVEAGSPLHPRPTQTLLEVSGGRASTRSSLDDWVPSASVYLGPRVGDISERKLEGFDWKATKGDDGRYTLTFCGNPAELIAPIPERASRSADSKRNLRLWKKIINGGHDLGRSADAIYDHLAAYRDFARRSANFPHVESDLEAVPITHQPRRQIERRSWSDAEGGRDRVEVILAGRFRAAGGVPTAAILQILERELGLPRTSGVVWDVYRSWVEAGCWDDCTKLSWRQSRAFGVEPHFVMYEVHGRCHATLVGLSTESFREAILEAAEGMQEACSVSPREPKGPWEPRTLEFSGSTEKLRALSAKMQIPAPSWMPSVTDSICTFKSVLGAFPSTTAPGGHERIRGWDWRVGGFVERPSEDPTRPRIDCFERPDRPWYYKVTGTEGRVLWTYSRNWALLAAHRLDGDTPFEKPGESRISTRGPASIYLPLSWGRLAHVCGGASPGLRPKPGSSQTTYAYDWPAGRLRDHVFDCLTSEE